MGKNSVELDRSQISVLHRRIAYWIPKNINTDSEYVIIIAFPLKQWLCERCSLIRYTYTVYTAGEILSVSSCQELQGTTNERAANNKHIKEFVIARHDGL